jgi:hypothetical protein
VPSHNNIDKIGRKCARLFDSHSNRLVSLHIELPYDLHIPGVSSANRTLPHYGRVARHPATIPKGRSSVAKEVTSTLVAL